MQMFFLFLFSLPVIAAQYYSIEKNAVASVTALASVWLLAFCLGPLFASLKEGKVRTSVGLTVLTALSLYFYAQLLSYYLQGRYFNQQFYFHLNFVTLIETWSVYYPLVFLFLFWILSVWLGFLYYRNRLPMVRYSYPVLAVLLLIAAALDPGIRSTAIAAFESRNTPAIASLDFIDWEKMSLSEAALNNANIQAAAGKNLVFVFMEGLEKIYTEASIFPGLTPNLTRLNSEGWQPHRLTEVQGSAWTMGGIVSSLCGTPLLYDSGLNGNDIMFTRFLNSAVCLPDVLSKAAYSQVFMGGASIDFAGKGEFLRNHSFDVALGKDQLESELPDASYMGSWGLYDESLLALAVGQFERLAEQQKPFNLTMLTVDTHHPTGESSPTCPPYTQIDNTILHAVHCTDFLIGKFIDQIKQHPSYEETLVVLVSDHLAMRNDAYSLFPPDYPRRLYLNILNAGQIESSGALVTPMDIAPTVLELMNVEHDASFLAGRSVIDKESELLEREQKGVHRLSRRQLISFINSNFLSPQETDLFYSLETRGSSGIDFSDHIVDIEETISGLEFTSVGNDPFFMLPPVSVPDGKDARLYVNFESEEASVITLYYSTELNGNFSEEKTISRPTVSGENQIVFRLGKGMTIGRLRLDPGISAGRYLIRSIEIRS